MSATARFRIRFRLRTLFIAIAVLALALGLGPSLWRMYRRQAALADCINADLPMGALLDSRVAELQSEREWAFPRLLDTIDRDPSWSRRLNALRTLRAFHDQQRSLIIRSEHLPELVRIATDAGYHDVRNVAYPAPQITFESELLMAITSWIRDYGFRVEDRARLVERARSVPAEARADWVPLLDALGGRDEIGLLLAWAEQDEALLVECLRGPTFSGLCWAEMLPRVRAWLDNPSAARFTVNHSILNLRPERRQVVLDFLRDERRPPAIRQAALVNLQHSIAGNELFLDAVRDPIAARSIAALTGGDPAAKFQATIDEILEDCYGDGMWKVLFRTIDHSTQSLKHFSPQKAAEFVKVRQKIEELGLLRLRVLSGRDDLNTRDEWEAWYESAKPDRVSPARLLQLSIDHPEALFHRRGFVIREGRIPPDCIPLYRRMLDHDDPDVRVYAAKYLLMFDEDFQAAEVLIELIDPDSHPDSDPFDRYFHTLTAIDSLRFCFAVNFSTDQAAWRKWLADARTDGQ